VARGEDLLKLKMVTSSLKLELRRREVNREVGKARRKWILQEEAEATEGRGEGKGNTNLRLSSLMRKSGEKGVGRLEMGDTQLLIGLALDRAFQPLRFMRCRRRQKAQDE